MEKYILRITIFTISLLYLISLPKSFMFEKIYAQAPSQTVELTSRQALSQNISKDEIINSWISYLDHELQNLIKKTYQISKDNNDTFEIIYSPDMFEDVISNTVDSQITFPKSNLYKSRENIYYIPVASYKKANELGKGFKIVNENLEVLIPPHAIDMENDIAILRMENDILKKQYEDYFIKITFRWHKTDKIQGNISVSDAVEIEFDTVYANKNINEWDKNLQNELIERKEQYISSSNCKKAISRIISNNNSPLDISLELEKFLSYGEREIVDITSRNMTGFVKVGFPLIDFLNPLIIIVSNENDEAVINGYEYSGSRWNDMKVAPMGKNHGMYIDFPGVYGFAGRNISLYGNDLENIGNSPDIIAKYHLDDFLGGKNIYTDALASRKLVVDCLSKIANTPIKPISKDLIQPITSQETLYLIMELYEIKTDTKISNMEIQNQISNMEFANLDTRYEQSIKAALELGLFNPENFEPTENITIGQFFTILDRLDLSINL